MDSFTSFSRGELALADVQVCLAADGAIEDTDREDSD